MLRPPGERTDAVMKLHASKTSTTTGTRGSMKLSDKKNTLEKTMKYLAILHGPDDKVIGSMNCDIQNGSAEISAKVEFPKITLMDKIKEWATPVLLLAMFLQNFSAHRARH